MIKGLPDKLKELRQTNRLSQKQVAQRLQVSPSIVSGYETGERTPSVENLLALSYLYHCSTDYLLGRDNTPQKPPDTPAAYRLDLTGLSDKQIRAILALIETMK